MPLWDHKELEQTSQLKVPSHDQVRVHVGIVVELQTSNFEQKQCKRLNPNRSGPERKENI